MKKIICILLVLCLCGCSAPAAENTTAGTTAVPTAPAQERILGTWQTAIDCSQICNGYILDTMGAELSHYFDVTGIAAAAPLTLQEDGSFTMDISQEAVDAYAGQVNEIMRGNLHSYLGQTLQEELAGQTLNAYLEETGLTTDDLLVAAGVNISQITNDLLEPLRAIPCSGTYYLLNDSLHIAGTVCSFTLTENTLTVSAPEDTADLAAFPALFPLKFTR